MLLIFFLLTFFNGLAVDFEFFIERVYLYNIDSDLKIKIEFKTNMAFEGSSDDFEYSVNNKPYITVEDYKPGFFPYHFIEINNENLVKDTNNIILRYKKYDKIAEFKIIYVKTFSIR